MQDTEQAEYLEEIADLKAKLNRLEEEQGDPELIEEYATEVRILAALLAAARQLAEELRLEPDLSDRLRMRGFSPTLFRDVYAFVYDSSLELDAQGLDFARAVERTNYSGLLTLTEPD